MRLTSRLGGARRLFHDCAYRPAMHAVHTQPHCGLGGGGQACRRAAGWVRRGWGEEVAHRSLGDGGGSRPPAAGPRPVTNRVAMGVLTNRRPWGMAGVLARRAPTIAACGRGGGEGGEGGRATAALAVKLPSDGTPGSGRVEHYLHPAAPPPCRHELSRRQPRPSVGVAPRAGVLVLRGQLGRPRGWRHRIPHGEDLRDGGQHGGGGRVWVVGRGEGPVAPEEAPDCTCGSLVANWKCEVGAHLGLSCALGCLCACLLCVLHAR